MYKNYPDPAPTIGERIVSPTSNFFRTLKLVGLCVSAAAAAILASPVALPVGLVAVAGYALAAGGAIIAMAQVTTKKD